MHTLTLTPKTLDGLHAKTTERTEYRDALAPGLRVRVAPGRPPRWSYCYAFRQGGRVHQMRLRLGQYPAVSLADARARAGALTAEIAAGGRPVNPARAPRRRAPVAAGGPPRPTRLSLDDLGPFLPGTFGALAVLYVATALSKKKPKGQLGDVQKLRTYLVPYWRDIPLPMLSRALITHRLDAIASAGSESDYMRTMRAEGKRHAPKPAPVMADRVGALVSRLANFAYRRGGWFRDGQAPPTLLLEHYAPPKRGGRHYLKRADVIALWRACQAETRAPVVAAALWLELLTGQRGGEILGMTWDELELDAAWWTIPGARTKNGRTHRVPLTPAAVAVLRAIRARKLSAVYVFPHAVRRNVARGTPAPAPGPLTHETRSYRDASRRIRDAVGFTPHDLRRTVNTHLARLKVPAVHADELLNHVRPGVSAVHYDEYEYDEEKRAALDVWDRELRAWLADVDADAAPTTGRLLTFPAIGA